MPRHIICKSHKDQTKTKNAMLWARPNIVFSALKASNSKVNGPIWPEFELIRDVMPVLVTCKFEEDSIKSEVAILRTTFFPL